VLCCIHLQTTKFALVKTDPLWRRSTPCQQRLCHVTARHQEAEKVYMQGSHTGRCGAAVAGRLLRLDTGHGATHEAHIVRRQKLRERGRHLQSRADPRIDICLHNKIRVAPEKTYFSEESTRSHPVLPCDGLALFPCRAGNAGA